MIRGRADIALRFGAASLFIFGATLTAFVAWRHHPAGNSAVERCVGNRGSASDWSRDAGAISKQGATAHAHHVLAGALLRKRAGPTDLERQADRRHVG